VICPIHAASFTRPKSGHSPEAACLIRKHLILAAGLHVSAGMWNEIRQSLRSLRRAPALTVVSVLTVALGVGAGTALFSVVKAVLLNPLPYAQPDRLAWLAALNDSRDEMRVSMADFDDWRRQNRSFASMAGYTDSPLVAGGTAAPERTHGAFVTEDFFEVTGAHPVLGRLFSPEEHRKGTALGSVVLGYGLWQRVYGGDRAILGRKIKVIGLPSTVIGVMPPGFAFPAGSELWVSARALGEGEERTAHNYLAVGRMRPGVSVEQASQDLSAIARGLKRQYAGPFQTADASAVPLARHLAGSVRTPLLVLFAAVGLLLLIVCVNVANLLLVRVTARSRELAMRTALGATGWRLFRQLLLESLSLSIAGGALGFVVAFWSLDLLRLLLPAGIPRATEVRMDGGAIAFAVALAAVTGILFGTLPSWRASRLNIFEALKAGARGQSAGRRSQRTQAALVISEVALSLMLLAGAGLLLQSFAKLRAVDPGFRADRVLTANLSFPVNAAARGRLVSAYRETIECVRALPGVEAAGTIKDLPFDPIQRDGAFKMESRRDLKDLDAGYLIVSPGLMEALRIPMVRGRRFNDSDSEQGPGVAIVSAEMARRFWPDRDPIGERIWYNSFDPRENWLTIVGVAGDVRQSGLTEPTPAQAYVCYPQVQIKGQLGSGNLVVRSAVHPASLAPAVRRIIHDVSPEAAAAFRPMSELLADATARQRFQMQVLGAFAALALLLAAVGLYGVLSYTVTSNRAQIGIRMALGAQPAEVFRMVAARAVRLTMTGTVAGLAGCLAVRSVLRKTVFGIGPSEPAVLLACWFPALRAMRVDPVTVLREE
jgi:putative ABC transport system permease protein